jgi:hypothetical protein
MAGRTLTNGDRLLLTLAVLALVVLYAVFWGRSVYGNQASIAVGGKHWSTVDLYQNRNIEVKGKIGISQLEVKDGKIRFVHSPCDTQQCVHQGWINQSGEIVACVPNAVSVRILGPDPRFDTMNF